MHLLYSSSTARAGPGGPTFRICACSIACLRSGGPFSLHSLLPPLLSGFPPLRNNRQGGDMPPTTVFPCRICSGSVPLCCLQLYSLAVSAHCCQLPHGWRVRASVLPLFFSPPYLLIVALLEGQCPSAASTHVSVLHPSIAADCHLAGRCAPPMYVSHCCLYQCHLHLC